jgi:hypothetical protein
VPLLRDDASLDSTMLGAGSFVVDARANSDSRLFCVFRVVCDCTAGGTSRAEGGAKDELVEEVVGRAGKSTSKQRSCVGKHPSAICLR